MTTPKKSKVFERFVHVLGGLTMVMQVQGTALE